MIRQVLFIIERLLFVLFAAHKIWFAVVCFYFAWMLAPVWVAAIPAVFGLLSFIGGAIETFDMVRRLRLFR